MGDIDPAVHFLSAVNRFQAANEKLRFFTRRSNNRRDIEDARRALKESRNIEKGIEVYKQAVAGFDISDFAPYTSFFLSSHGEAIASVTPEFQKVLNALDLLPPSPQSEHAASLQLYQTVSQLYSVAADAYDDAANFAEHDALLGGIQANLSALGRIHHSAQQNLDVERIRKLNGPLEKEAELVFNAQREDAASAKRAAADYLTIAHAADATAKDLNDGVEGDVEG